MSDNFVAEAWTYLAIDIVVVGIRSVARWRQQGLQGLAMDDFLMVIAIVSSSRLLLFHARNMDPGLC